MMTKIPYTLPSLILCVLLVCCVPGAVVGADSNSNWSGCGPLNDPTQPLKVGSLSVVCLQVGNTNNWVGGATYLRMSFQPKVDQYSRFHVANSYRDLTLNNPFRNRNITVNVAQQTRVTFLREYYNAVTKLIYPHLTAIVDVDEGRVRGITWDDACVFCGGGQCVDVTYNYEGVLQSQASAGQPVGGCPMATEECDSNPAACDLTIYVVWSGTDVDGVALQSSASRFSMFPPQDLKDRFTQNIPTITMPTLPSMNGGS